MLSKNKGGRLKNYRKLSSLEEQNDVSKVLDKKKWPAIMGSVDFTLKRQHGNIVFLRGFADVRKKMGTDSFHEFKCA
jgi:hypothetical protein